jgi:glycosyltransferase involved in cell wall biosynthesis
MSRVVVCGRPQNLARARELAAALGGHAVSSPWRRPGDRRPWIVTAPPTELALASLFPRTVLDAHTGSFGLKGDRRSLRRVPLLRAMTRRAAAVMVCSESLADRVAGWGGRPLIVHEAPPLEVVAPALPLQGTARVLVPGYFTHDEPIGAALDALRRLDDVTFELCGSLARLAPDLVARAPAAARFHGRLAHEDYVQAIEEADVVLALTSSPESVMRVAYEAVWHGRPLVISDTAVNRALFPFAVHVANDGAGIAAGIEAAIGGHDRLRSQAGDARRLQHDRVARQLEALMAVLAFAPGEERNVPLRLEMR